MLDLIQFGSPKLSELMSPDCYQTLLSGGRCISYPKGTIVHQRGDDKPGLSIVDSGRVEVGNTGSDGSFLVTSIMGPGQCFGEFTVFAGLPRTHTITAAVDSRIHQIPAPKVNQLLDREPAVSRAFLTLSLLRTHGLLEFSDDFRRLPKIVHLAKFIWSIAEASTETRGNARGNVQGNECIAYFRQQDLAYTFGLSRVSVSKSLNKLQNEGLIELGYGCVRFPNPDKLKRWLAEHQAIEPLTSNWRGSTATTD